MIYITGDTHGQFKKIKAFCNTYHTKVEDIMIILGDAGINYFGNIKDLTTKNCVKKLPITLFCIHGNHEMRPEHIKTYKIVDFMGGKTYHDSEYPNIYFAIDGETYTFNNLKTMVCGGAYSVDKDYRILTGAKWFFDEQPNENIKQKVEDNLAGLGNKIDVFLSHTCPYNYLPTEMFLSNIDQSTVDNSTEIWLQKIEDKLNYKAWYCGHFHTDKKIDKIHFLFNDIIEYNI